MARRESPLAVVASIAGLAVAFGLGELAVRAIDWRSPIYNIEMLRYAKELKLPDPLCEITHVHRPNASATLMGVEIRLNSLGYRGPELAQIKPRGAKRILVLGSSVTMGWGIPESGVFTTLLEERLNRERPFGPRTTFELVNAGVGNYGVHAETVMFLRQYRRVDPDLVVLQYFPQDVEPRVRHGNVLLRHSYLAAYLSNCLNIVRFSITRRGDLYDYYREMYAGELWKETLSDVRRLKQAADGQGIALVVMVMPEPHDLSPDSPYRPLLESVARDFRALGIPTVNTFDAFSRRFNGRAERLWLRADDPHYNAKGHELMADALFRYLVEKDPLRLRRRE